MTQRIKGKLKLIEDGKLLKYGVYRGYDMFDLDSWLWNNTGRQVKVKIYDNKNQIILNAKGRLKIDCSNGYLKYRIRCNKKDVDLDAILWDNVDEDVYIEIDGFVIPN